MIENVSVKSFNPAKVLFFPKTKTKNTVANPISFSGNKVAADKLSQAYKGYNNIKPASTVSFKGAGSLFEAFEIFSQALVTCKDAEHGRNGENVGSRLDVSELMSDFGDKLPKYDDAIKTTEPISESKGKNSGKKIITDARCQIKNSGKDELRFEMIVRPPRMADDPSHRTRVIPQILRIELEPYSIELDKNHQRHIVGTEETAYVLNTKGKLMAIVEDGNNVLLTSTGEFEKKDKNKGGKLRVFAREYDIKGPNNEKLDTETLATYMSTNGIAKGLSKKVQGIKNVYRPFEVTNNVEVREKSGGSQGGGTELVIGLEDGRFVPEIIDSIQTFVNKVQNGEIVLDEFKPAQNAQSVQISMLAGGFGSRAEYTNASASRIFHDEEDGSNLTKGCFRTATGLTPMETTFISLHKAGLLDCSKENLGIGKNIKFYLNDSHVNGGNGGFTVDMYNTMQREGRNSLLILPNDAMSRIPNAISKMTNIMNSGKAAVVMVAKEVDKEDARGSLGIMKINDKGEIEAFAEKPKVFEEGYVDNNGKCFANTFQFTVSKEAFEALAILEPYLPPNNSGKEPRDWSKTFTPILMALTQNDNPDDIKKQIEKTIKKDTPKEVIQKAKDVLGEQKIYAVKSNEPWADCGTLNALYHTTMQIASGEFPLEDFERKHVLDCVNTRTGLVASTPEQKKEIEEKYNIKGQVMAVPKAKPTPNDTVKNAEHAITRYSDKH